MSGQFIPTLKHVWVLWQRRWRLAEVRLLFVALLVAASVVTAVGFFTDRVDSHMAQQASGLLGGDLVITSARPFPVSYAAEAQRLGVQTSSMIKFVSMASHGDAFQLAQVKAVTAQYPLKGEVRISPELATETYQVAQTIPATGEVWADGAILQALHISIGDKLQLGTSQFVVKERLVQDPDQGTNFIQFAPPLLLNQADLAATELLSAGSRAEYSLFFAGENPAIQTLRTWLKSRLQTTERIRSLEDGVPSAQQALDRASRFLSLAALLSVVIAGVAIALTSASLLRREAKSIAVLKALGQTRRPLLWELGSLLLGLTLVAGVLGSLLGFGLQLLLAERLASLMGEQLPEASLRPLLFGLLTLILVLLGFAWPYLVQLTKTAPLRILQSNVNTLTLPPKSLLLLLLPCMYLLFWLQGRDALLALWLLGGGLVGIVLFWLVAQGLMALITRLSLRYNWRWLSVFRSAKRSMLLLLVFACGFFSLLLLTSVRTDLLNRWQESLPVDAPNHFMINIQPNQQAAIETLLTKADVAAQFYPMIRGRLVKINDKAVEPEDYRDERAKALLTREFNISSYAELPSSNELIAGQWFSPQLAQGLSIEEGIGQTLGFGLGDRLTFDIAGTPYQQIITSVRKVRWDSMQPNFFVIAAPHELDNKPYTAITSIYLPAEKAGLMTELLKQFPSVTDINVSQVLAQVRDLIRRASLAVQGIFLFTLVSGIVVLVAALQTQKPERQREIAILKAMGAGQAELRWRIVLEFLALGGLAGLLGGLLASVLGSVLAYQLFDLVALPSVMPLLLGFGGGALLVGVAGFLNLRPLLSVPPAILLREG